MVTRRTEKYDSRCGSCAEQATLGCCFLHLSSPESASFHEDETNPNDHLCFDVFLPIVPFDMTEYH